MIGLPSETRVWLASGMTDMRRYAEHRIMLSPRRPLSQRRAISVRCCVPLGL
jgi:hypothetical protein